MTCNANHLPPCIRSINSWALEPAATPAGACCSQAALTQPQPRLHHQHLITLNSSCPKEVWTSHTAGNAPQTHPLNSKPRPGQCKGTAHTHAVKMNHARQHVQWGMHAQPAVARAAHHTWLANCLTPCPPSQHKYTPSWHTFLRAKTPTWKHHKPLSHLHQHGRGITHVTCILYRTAAGDVTNMRRWHWLLL
jgi:hypothetical protein